MLPAFQAEATLPMALGSVLAQTWTDWECICVDDGSTDGTWPLLERAHALDPRIRIERFTTNRGRGAARQRSLELASGSYLAFLDSDDWLYPEKLHRQVQVLDAAPDLALVSSTALVTRGDADPIGVARRGADPHEALTVHHFDQPQPPRLVFPTVMVRMNLARATGFDIAMRRSQDSDFVIRLLLGRKYGAMTDILYAYSQGTAASLEKTLEGYRYRIRSHIKHVRSHPLRVSRTVLETAAKLAIYRLAGKRGAARLIAERWDRADPPSIDAFRRAHRTVTEHAKTLT